MKMEESYRKLISLASSQGGLFTAAQASDLGISQQRQSQLAASGEWVRQAHGIYRLADLPETDSVMSQYHKWLLWGVNRKGESEVAYAYETALAIYGLSDIAPSKIHLTVPTNFKRSVLPKVLTLHKEDRDRERDVWEWSGLRIVRPLYVILDLIREERISTEHIERAFVDGRRKGLIAELDMEAAPMSPREKRLLKTWDRS